MKRRRVAVIVGTRPEAIKMAPVIHALSRSRILEPLTVSTSQHDDMVSHIFRSFGLRSDYELRVMRRAQTLWDLAGRLASRLGRFFEAHPVDAILVQGDTSSAFFGGLCGFYHQIPVGHVEAGLRTGNLYAPFPEEMNRTLLAAIATWHFAPTRDAKACLRREGVPAETIYVTGNTVVDALQWMASRCGEASLRKLLGTDARDRRLILVTFHRRESIGAPMRNVAKALALVARRNPEAVVLFPIHPNPAVLRNITPSLSRIKNVVLSEPLGYDVFLSCLKHAYLIISDSGGVQEEATALGKPVLVLREETERPEGVKTGTLRLVGNDARRLVKTAQRLLDDPQAYRLMCRASAVFGDGKAASRIIRILEKTVS